MDRDETKTKQELIAELEKLRRHLSSDHELKAAQAEPLPREPAGRWLASTALELLALSTRQEIIDFAGHTLTAHLGDCVIVMLTTDSENDTLRVQAIFGLEQSLMAQALDQFGGALLGRSFPIELRFEAAYAERTLCHHEGGLSHLAGNAVPDPIVQAIERLLDIHDVYTMALVGQTRMLGNVHILTRAPSVVQDKDSVETFAHQVALALERASATETLERNEERLSALFRYAADAIYVTKLDGTIIQVNERACRSTGYAEQELLSLSISDIDTELGELLDLPAPLEDFSVDHPLTIKSQHRRRDGTTFPVEVKITDLHTPKGPCILAVARDITERSESELRYERILETATDGFWVIDGNGDFVEVNAAAADMLGYTEEELAALHVSDIDAAEDREAVQRHINHVRGTGTDRFETRHRRKDGSRVDVDVSVSHLPIGEGRLVVFTRDITARKLAESRREVTLKLLQQLNKTNELHDLMADVTALMREWSGCEAVGIRLEDGEDYPYFETRGFPSSFVRAESSLCEVDDEGDVVRDALGNPVLECMCGNVVRERFDPDLPFFTENGSFWTNSTTDLLASTTEEDRQTRTRNRCHGEGYESVALVPLRHGDQTFGILQFNDPRRGCFDAADIEHFERLAASLSLGLAQCQAAHELRESMNKYRTLVETIPHGIEEVDLEGRVTFSNQAHQEILGYDEEQLSGKYIWDHSPSEELRIERKAYFDRIKREQPDPEPNVSQNVTREGRLIDLLVDWNYKRDEDGALDGFISVLTDITKRKRAEEALRRSQADLQAILNSTQQAFLLIDHSLSIKSFNQAAAHNAELVFGLSMARGQSIFEYVLPRDKESFKTHFEQALGGQMIQVESRFPGGHWFSFTFNPIRGVDGEIAGVCFNATDVTERREAAEALRASEEAYRSLIERAPIGIFATTSRGEVIDINTRMAQILGYEDIESALQAYKDLGQELYVDPGRREVFLNALREHGSVERFEYRAYHRDGHQIWLQMTARVSQEDPDGALLIEGFTSDVTQWKMAEEARRESEERYRRLVEESPDIHYVYSSKRGGLFWSERVRDLLGFAPNDLRDAPYLWHDAIHPDDLSAVDDLIGSSDAEAPYFDIEYRIKDADGRWHWFQDRCISRRRQGDEVIIEGIATDVTERKRTQAALQESEERLQKMLDSQSVGIAISRRSDGTFLEVNPGFVSMSGYSRDELIGHTSRELGFFSLEQRDALNAQLEAHSQLHHQELTVPTKSGEQRTILFSIAPITAHGEDCFLATMVDITERKQAQQALRRSEERYRRVLDTMNEGLATMDKTGRFTYVNDAFCTMLAYSPNELIGRSHLCVVAPSRREEHRQYFVDRKHGEAKVFETLLRRKDGTNVHVILAGTPVTDQDGAFMGTIGAITDITERKRAEEALRQSEAFLRQVIDTSPNCIFVKDWDGRYLLVNDAIARLYDTPKDEMVGKTDPELAGIERLSPEEAEQFVADDREVITSGEPKLIPEERFTLAGGTTRWFQTVKVPLAVGFDQDCMLGVAADITERKQMEEELRQQERLAAVGQLAGGIAHDFNNLLASIILYAQMPLNNPQLAPSTADALNTILEESRRAADLVQQILDFGRSAMIEVKPISLDGIVDDALALLRRTIPEDISLSTSFVAGTTIIEADPTRIHQVLMNLALNAKDAMPDGGELSFEVSPLFIADDADGPFPEMRPGHWARLTVSDTGTGMTEEVQSHLFEPFFTTKEVDEGTGLGLAQVYGIVKQHKGFIDVETAVGEGTTFHIFLPCIEADQQLRPSDDEPQARQGSETILVVEDAEQLRRAIKAALEPLGYRILLAVDGRDAIRVLPNQDVDLVLTDVVMPQMGGEALLRALRREDPTLKVIAMTGHVFDQDASTLKRSGFNDALYKPFSIADLTETVRVVLGE